MDSTFREVVNLVPFLGHEVISRFGLRNARLSGVQGVFQLAIIIVMVYIRLGGF